MRMRLLLPLFLLILVFAANPAFAQDTALPGVEAPDRSIDEQLGITKPAPKRKSTGNLKRDYALQYYDECVKREHPYVSAEARKLLCGCTSQEIEANMPYNELVEMFTDEQKAPKIHQELLKTAYADCMRHPISEMMKKDCNKMPALDKIGEQRRDLVCECTGDTMARYLTARGREIIRNNVQRYPENIDPIGLYLESNSFKTSYSSYLDRCIDLHVFGYK